MRWLRNITLAIATIAAAFGLCAATGDSGQPFTITISAPHTIVRVGEEVRIHVVLTNVSDQESDLQTTFSVECDYGIRVQGPNGLHTHEPDCSGSSSFTRLKPGKKLEDDATLTKTYQIDRQGEGLVNTSKKFDFASPGEYVVQLSRHVSDDPDKALVTSNEISITVIPGDADAATAQPHPFSIAISTPNETIKVGDPVRIHVVLKDISDQDIAVPDPSSSKPTDGRYTISVSGPNISMNKGGGTYVGPRTILKPGEQIEEDDILQGNPFDFNAPGKYVIQFFQSDGDDSNPWSVKSNKITIAVTE